MRVQQLVERALVGEDQISLMDEYLGLEEMSDEKKAAVKKWGKRALVAGGAVGLLAGAREHGKYSERKEQKAKKRAGDAKRKELRREDNERSKQATRARKAQEKDQPK